MSDEATKAQKVAERRERDEMRKNALRHLTRPSKTNAVPKPKHTRDYTATLDDDQMCVTMAKNHQAIDQALQQIQRHTALTDRPNDPQGYINFAGQMVAFGIIQEHIHNFVARGQAILDGGTE